MEDIYNTQYWSDGYFRSDDSGQLVARTLSKSGEAEAEVSFADIQRALAVAGLRWPVLVRFPHILRDRVRRLCGAFEAAMQQQQYPKQFFAVYPIKVNQQRKVVEEIIGCHDPDQNRCVGLEAGSKPELLAVLAMSQTNQSLIICNGYKDASYVRLALLGQKMGLNITLVIEKPSELSLILEQAKQLSLKPQLGIRVRLSNQGKGNWQNSGGEKAKFGLSASALLGVVNALTAAESLDCLRLLHFHMGSQISDIQDIRACMNEATRYFIELGYLGAPIEWLDVGGGLGVDYEGTCSSNYCSMNYSMQEYAQAIVSELKLQCDNAQVPVPNIIAESGRALTAHHAVLLTQVMQFESPLSTQAPPQPPADTASDWVMQLWQDYQASCEPLNPRTLISLEQRLKHNFSRVAQRFTHAGVSLCARAQAESYYYSACENIRAQLDLSVGAHRSLLDELNDKLAHNLFVNFSLFQSIPDVWGIGQIFPIIPLHGLNATHYDRARIQDITCDSDGCVKAYVDGMGIESTLPIPSGMLKEGDLLGMFLVGAYQEILGDMHNLFGDTDAADVEITCTEVRKSEVSISATYAGDTVGQVLKTVNFQDEQLVANISERLRASNLPQPQQHLFFEEFQNSLAGYTYLEF